MKKFLCFTIIMILVLLLAGCSKKKDEASNELSCTINGIEIVPGEDFAEPLDKLGTPSKYSEGVSCYFDGMDKVYTYDGYEISTYPTGDIDNVLSVQISADTMKTDKNITVGSTVDELVEAYGEDYNLVGNKYRYDFDNDRYMYFITMDNKVRFYGYAIDAEN